ncbi:hypothetical protein [Streptococcus suis]|uniref:hypothetical protein n=1 Tax=Streptococcus suis TaxID=1307 RepID=UPI003B9FD53F
MIATAETGIAGNGIAGNVSITFIAWKRTMVATAKTGIARNDTFTFHSWERTMITTA